MIVAAGLGVAPLIAQAADRGNDRAAVLIELAACRRLAEPTQRLACFDLNAAKVDDAERNGDLLVADRLQVQQSKRSLFGLELPSFDLFKHGKGGDRDDVRQIESTIAGASFSNLKWVFALTDGGRWRQTEVQTILDPRRGDKVLVRRAAMGSYMLKVNGGTAVRVERIN